MRNEMVKAPVNNGLTPTPLPRARAIFLVIIKLQDIANVSPVRKLTHLPWERG